MQCHLCSGLLAELFTINNNYLPLIKAYTVNNNNNNNNNNLPLIKTFTVDRIIYR